MKLSNKITIPLATFALIAGGAASAIALQTHAQTTSATTTAATTPSVTAGPPQGHAPLGGDGNITAINGNVITMQEETDEGGASYTVDASNAAITNNGAAATLSSLTVGEKIFVQGTTSGTNVTATSVSVGHPGRHGDSSVQSN